MPQRIRPLAVAFDLDGLMFDTEALFFRVAGAMLAARGKALTQAIMNAMIGRGAADAGESFKRMAGLDEPVEDLMSEARSRFMAEIDTAVHPTPGLFALLGHLQQLGIPRVVTTSSCRVYAEGLLRKHGVFDHFAGVLTGDDVTNGKPDPEIYLKAAESLGVEPGRMPVLEDSAPGLASAKAAGAFAVGVPHGHSPAEGLSQADLIIPRLDAPVLLELLERKDRDDEPS